VLYGNLPVVFYPTNANYTLLMTTNLPANWITNPVGDLLITLQITNAPANAVFRLH